MLAILIAALLAGEAPITAPPLSSNPPVQTLQAQFDGANEAYQANRIDEAIERFEALEANPKVQKNPLVLSTVLMRKGASLIELGRVAEAEIALRQGLKIAPPDRAELKADRYMSEQSLGLIDIDRLEYAAATRHFEKARALADEPNARASVLVRLALVTTFEPGDDAVHYADRALAEIGIAAAKDEKVRKLIADLQTVRARALLNQGRFPEALGVLQKAVKDQGDLDLKVDISEIVTRSDIAIAAMLSGRPDTARKYLAYTGAGRIEDAPFERAMSMDLPACGGPSNLKPEDVAVVEFGIATDGSVKAVRPIYASVKGSAALDFARAVSGWSWRSADVAKIPPLFRAVTRVELRCSTGAERPPAQQLLMTSLADWSIRSQLQAPPRKAPATRSPCLFCEANWSAATLLAAASLRSPSWLLWPPTSSPPMKSARFG